MKPFFLLLGLLLGLGIGKWGNVPFCIGLILLTLCLGFLAFKKGEWKIYLLGFCLGLATAFLPLIPLDNPTGNYVITGRGNGYVLVSDLTHHYYLKDGESRYEIGDIIHIEGNIQALKINTYESQFSFKDYLLSYGVKQEIGGSIRFLFKGPFRYAQAEKAFLAHFDDETSAVLGKLLFGMSQGNSDTLDKANDLSLLYLLSAGGFLFSFLLRFIERVLGLYCKEQTAKKITFFFSLVFLPMGLRKIGIARVIVNNGLALVSRKRKRERITTLSLSGIILLAINPYFAFQSGFLLGYGLGFFFLFLFPLVEKYKRLPRMGICFLLLRVFLLPLYMMDGKLPLLAMFLGPLLWPFAIAMLVLGYLSFITIPFTNVLPFFAKVIGHLMNVFSFVTISIWVVAITAVGSLLFYCVYFACIHFHTIGFKRYRNGLALGTISIYLWSLFPLHHYFTSEVIFVNVGQGDCILLRSQNKTVMLDSGGSSYFDVAQETLIPYLYKRRIYKIDCFIASHGDFDHVGAYESLSSKFKVGRYIEDANEFPLTIGNMEFNNYNTYGGAEENDNSLVLSTSIGGRTYLLMGDAPSQIEERIIQDHPELRCDILKAGHHGSKTSTSASFLDTVRPKEAIISCGGKNAYGHPNEEVISRLQERNITIRRTDEEGSIVYYGWA